MQGLFLDLSSAFEKVWHSGLLAKLSQIGVEGIFHDILSSYLSDRKQIVVVNGEKSNMLDINACVLQGSRLGPLLFIAKLSSNLEFQLK